MLSAIIMCFIAYTTAFLDYGCIVVSLYDILWKIKFVELLISTFTVIIISIPPRSLCMIFPILHMKNFPNKGDINIHGWNLIFTNLVIIMTGLILFSFNQWYTIFSVLLGGVITYFCYNRKKCSNNYWFSSNFFKVITWPQNGLNLLCLILMGKF